MPKQQVFFIVNPISGKQKHHLDLETIIPFFSKDNFEITVWQTQKPKHAITLTQNAIAAGASCVVACGGDGTINEVASCLVSTDITLGIIPVGSGNGLASHLLIPKNVEKALQTIANQKTTRIDVGQLKQMYFFSNMGFGMDATIIKNYQESKTRTLVGYLKAIVASMNQFTYKSYQVIQNQEVKNIKPYLFFVSNSNEMGYGMSLTPKAKLNDGFLNLFTVEAINFWQQLRFGLCLLIKNPELFNKSKSELITKLTVINPNEDFYVQLDGEFCPFEANELNIAVLPNSLKVCVV
jgi:diacylglycerol kinase (ATP)